MKTLRLLLVLIMLSVIYTACKKDSMNTTSDQSSTLYSIRMTDAPASYDAVNIDLRGVELIRDDDDDDHEHHSHHNNPWDSVVDDPHSITIMTPPRIINLLDLSNGLDTLVASAFLTANHIKQIRLILGPNNSVVVDGVSNPLVLSSEDEVGLKINVKHHLHHGQPFNVVLDFDADKSIVHEGNGTYRLKPVIRLIESTDDNFMFGSIRGTVTPAGTLALVTAISATANTYSTYVNHEGEFKLRGLPAGTYTVTITNGVSTPISVTNVTVTADQTADIGTLHF